MLSKLFRSRASVAPVAPTAAIPAGRRVYAIGDVHGRLDLLDDVMAQIEADDRARPAARTSLVFLGDLIDRGPESAAVVDRVIAICAAPDRHLLIGNHEEILLLALDGDLEAMRLFCRIGGRETILSYGVTEAQYEAADYRELLQMLGERVPSSHLRFLRGAEDLIEIGDYAFAHAGVRPGVPLAEQSVADLRWIRREFLEYRGTLERVVVHGHTIVDEVESLPHRIGIDTGAFRSGRLTALGLEGTDRWLLQTRPEGA